MNNDKGLTNRNKQSAMESNASTHFYLLVCLLTLFSSLALAHDGPPQQLNTQSCSGVMYHVGRWNETSRPGGGNAQPVLSCDNSRDNCGQFRLAMDYSQTFCSIQTGGLKQAIFNVGEYVYYHGPATLVQPRRQTSYDLLLQGIDFSCQLCAPNESVRFENQGHQHKEQFFTHDDIYLHWWRSSPHPTYAYHSYQLKVSKRGINSQQAYQLVSHLPASNQTFQRVALSQLVNIETCHEFQVTLTTEDGQGIKASSNHYFTVFDMNLCPPRAQSLPGDPFPVP